MTSFQDILNMPTESIKPPKPLPIGTYMCVVDGVPEIKQMGKAGNSAAIFKFKPLQAQPDVDQQALIEALSESGKALADMSVSSNMWLTDAAAYRVKDLLEQLGVEMAGKSLGQAINEAPGRQLLVNIAHRPSDDGKMMFMEVKNTAAV